MSLEELKRKFIVDEDTLRTKLEALVHKASTHCVVDTKGGIHINNSNLKGRDRLKLALAARALAARLDDRISAEVSVPELVTATGLPANQVRARATEIVEGHFAETVTKGVYRANAHRVEQFITELPEDSR